MDPHPKLIPNAPTGIAWPVGIRLRCPEIVPPPSALFTAVLEARRSHRELCLAPLREILNAIAFATRPRFLLEGDLYRRSRRLPASAGALHPIEILIACERGSG